MKWLLSTVLCTILCISANGQLESKTDFRFNLNIFSCATNEVCFFTEVRLNQPNQPDGTIELADVNYRYFYPNNIMEFRTLEGLVPGYLDPSIDQSGPLGTVPGGGIFGPAFDGTDGLGYMDYDINVDGNSNATTLTADWLRTSRICFEIVDPSQIPLFPGADFCTQIVWADTAYAGVPNPYLFVSLTATEVESGGGSLVDQMDEIQIHYGWTEVDNSLDQSCISVDCIFPVELIKFEASLVSKNEVRLNWETAQEINSSHYEIERKEEGSEVWEKVSQVEAMGETFAKTIYQKSDLLPEAGNVFHYRLKIIDKDGTFEYSPSSTIRRSGERAVSLFPNPAQDFTHINFKVNGNKSLVEISLIDIAGKGHLTKLYSKELDHGIYGENLDISSFQAGTYIIQVVIGDLIEQTMLVIAR